MKRYTIMILAAALVVACTMTQVAPERKAVNPRDMQGKASAQITISYAGDTEINWGMIGDVTVYITPERDAESLSVSITPDAIIEIIYGPQQMDFGAVAAGQEVSMKVRYMAPEEGLYYLNVLATGTFAGKVMSRTGAVPVKIDAPVSPFRDASGLRQPEGLTVKDGLVIMQAKE